MIKEVELFVEGKSANTKRTYLSLGRSLEKFLESKKIGLKDMQPIHCKEWIYSAKAMNSKMARKRFLKALLRFVGRNDLVNYIKKSMKEIKEKDWFKVDITPEEVGRLIAVTRQPELRFAWAAMALADLRPGEVLGLFFEDVDLQNKRICLRRREGVKYGPKAMKPDDEPKFVPLDDFVAELFLQVPKNASGRIVPISYKTLRKWFKRYVKEAGWKPREYPITPHKLRHFYGHFWTKRSKNIRVLQKIMRHSKIDYTLRYTEPGEKEIEEEFEKVMKNGVKLIQNLMVEVG